MYYVDEAGYRTNVTAVEGAAGTYLRTTADLSSANNLGNLPECRF